MYYHQIRLNKLWKPDFKSYSSPEVVASTDV